MSLVGSHPTYRYNPNPRDGQRVPDECFHHQPHAGAIAFEVHTGLTTSTTPMRRYIDEPECVLFDAPVQPIPATLPPFHSLDIASYAHASTTHWPHSLALDAPSPSLSGPTSSYFSSCASERHSTPLSPPDSAYAIWSPEYLHAEHLTTSVGGGQGSASEQNYPGGFPCVAMHDVQSYEDLQPDTLAYEEDTHYYGSYSSATHEGYQPIASASDVADSGVEYDNDNDKDYHPHSPDLGRRRPQVTRSVTAPRAPSKVTKRSRHARRSSALQAKKHIGDYHDCNGTGTIRPFACALAPYGCTSTFGSKNEWKRHVNTQHMRLSAWRCDQCDQEKKPNDFNRKDLFIQHVRRMHPVNGSATTENSVKQPAKSVRGSAEDQTLNALAERCLQRDRPPPSESGCHFCETVFEDSDGSSAQTLWDKRLEHMAQHMEDEKKTTLGPADPRAWPVDARFERWLIDNGIVVAMAGGGYMLA